MAKIADIQLTPTPGGPATPTPTPESYWYQRWTSWSSPEWSFYKDCSAPPLACGPGDCENDPLDPKLATPDGSQCYETPVPGGCGANPIVIDQRERYSCPQENQLMGALVVANICCPNPPCPYEASMQGQCLVVADAYDCRNNLVASFCMDNHGPYYPGWYEVDTECVFDRWTAPCKWVIRKNGTSYELKCNGSSIRYYCCEPDCHRAYVEGPQ